MSGLIEPLVSKKEQGKVVFLWQESKRPFFGRNAGQPSRLFGESALVNGGKDEYTDRITH
jgi:hypothetical protein